MVLLAEAEVLAGHSKMNKRFFLLFSILLLFNLAAAYPINIQLNGNMNFNTSVYYCATDSSCATSTFFTSGAGNPILYQITNQGAGTRYFAEYDYVANRCYVSHSYKNWFDENTGNGPWQYPINFAKQGNCQSNINSVNFTSQIFNTQQQNVTVNARSPLDLNVQGPSAVPAALQYFYSTNVTAFLTVRNATSIVYSASQNADILWGSSRNFSFLVPLLPAGTYTAEVRTNVIDCMCSSYVQQQSNNSFNVVQNTAPNVSIASPQNNSNFTINDTINFAGSATDVEDGSLSGASLQWYSSLQGNIGQSVSFLRNLSAGLHRITLVATDAGGLNSSAIIWVNVSTSPVPSPQPQPLSANFTFTPSNPVVNQIVTFDASSSIGNITSYFWDFNDSTNSNGAIVTHAFNAARNYSVMLTVTDNRSNTSSLTLIVPVTAPTTPSPNAEEEVVNKRKGDIDNAELRSFDFTADCFDTSALRLEFYNNQRADLNDVYAIAEIPELNIKERSSFFDIDGKESEIVNINLALPRLSGDFSVRTYLHKGSDVTEFVRRVSLNCAEAAASEAGNQTGMSISTSTTETDKEGGSGLTGFVVNVGRGFGSRLNQILFLLVVILAIAVYFRTRKK